MQYELRTQVIEPRRKTFQHLIDRYGDKPASRYEEGTVDLEPTNFHYRPTWAPDKELYDADYSAFKLTDPYNFTDPRQYYYAPYVTNRSGLHEAFGKTLDYLSDHDLVERLPENWKSMLTRIFVALRHYESGGQLIYSGACRYSFGATLAQCCAYSAFDRIANAQMISRMGIAIGGGTTSALELAKDAWLNDDALQGLRRLEEELMIEDDWAVAVIGLDLTDRLIYGLMYRHLDEAALMGGAGSYSLVAQHLAGWFVDQRKWVDHLNKTWFTDAEHGEDNKRLYAEVANRRLPQIVAAVTDLAKAIDQAVPNVGAADAVQTLAEEVVAQLGGLGVQIDLKEKA